MHLGASLTVAHTRAGKKKGEGGGNGTYGFKHTYDASRLAKNKKKRRKKKRSVVHPDALLFFISPLVYSEPSADFPEDM